MTLKEKIAAARAADPTLTDDEIWAKIQTTPEYKQAKSQNMDDGDITSHLGLKPVSSETKEAAGPSVGAQVAHGLAVGGSGLVKGAVEGTVGLPGTILSAEKQYLPDSVNNALKYPILGTLVNGPLSLIQNLTGKDVLPTGQSLEGHLNSMGLNAAPQGHLEEQIDAMSRGVGAAAATLPLGGAGVLPTLASGATSGEGAYLAQGLVPDSAPDWVKTGAGLAGGIIGGGIGGINAQKIVNNISKRGVAGAEGNVAVAGGVTLDAQKALDAAKSSHQELQNTGTALNLAHRQEIMDLNSEHSNTVATANAKAQADIIAATAPAQKTITTTADNLGTSDTPQAAGESLQSHARNWLGDFDNKQEKIWSPVDSAVPDSYEVGLPNFKSALDDMNTKAGSLEPLNKLLKPSMPQQLSQALNMVKAGAEDDIITPPTYGDVRILRTTLGKALADPQILNKVGDSNLKQLYGALTSDIRDSIKPLGLSEDFDAANAASSKLYDFAENRVGKIVNSDKNRGDPDPESVASRLMALGSKGGTMFSDLRAQMPEAMDDLASFAIRGGKWNKLAPEAKEGLVPDPGTRSALNAAHSTVDNAQSSIQSIADKTISDSQNNITNIKAAHGAEKLSQDKALFESNKNVQDRTEGVQKAKEAQESAQKVVDHLKASFEGGSKKRSVITDLLKSDVGSNVAETVLKTLGIPDAVVTAGKLALAGAPLAKYGIDALRRNPMILGEAGRGGAVGAQAGRGKPGFALTP